MTMFKITACRNKLYKACVLGILSSITLLTACVTTQQPTTLEKPKQPIVKQPLPLSENILNYQWQLSNAVNGSGSTISTLTEIKNQVTLAFHLDNRGNALSFSVGCNGFGSNYQLNKSGQMMTKFILGTEMYCEQLNTAERMLVGLMTGNSQLSFKQEAEIPMLTQTTANGSLLTWHGTLKNDVKYGEGETIFLEVAPKTEYCSSGINQQCLKVRNVYYDENSIKSDYSDWRLMKNPIQGYTHDSSTRQILRVKKYITNPIDVKGKQLVYVLDMTVETETVK